MNRKIVIIGAVLILFAIILGAFGAHALEKVLTTKQLSSYETGVRYQMYHGLAFLILGFNSNKFYSFSAWTTRTMLAGILLFSCSIYLLALQDVIGVKMSFLGPVTPFGGVLLIFSWILLIIQVFKNKFADNA